MSEPATYSPWVLSLAFEIDQHCPGFCGEFFRASVERRQVFTAYLSAKPPSPPEMAEVGQFLLSADHQSILSRAYPEVPSGLRGALRRAGRAAHERRFYSLLYELLSTPPHSESSRCISRLGSLDFSKLLIIRILPATICRANVVESINRPSAAKDIVTGYRLLTSRGVDGASLTAAIQQVRSERELSKVWNTWLLKAQAPPHPVPKNDCYLPVASTAGLNSLARRYQNCARRFLTDLLDDEAGQAFAEARHGNEGVVVHLEKESGKWRMAGLFGPRNARPSPAMREHVAEYLRNHGVKVGDRARPERSEWDALRRLASAPLFDFEFE